MDNSIARFQISADEDFRIQFVFVGLSLAGRTLRILVKERASNVIRTTLTLGAGLTLDGADTVTALVPLATASSWAKGEFETDLHDITGGANTRLVGARTLYDLPGRLPYGAIGAKATVQWVVNKAVVTAIGGIGPTGPANTLTIGDVATLETGQPATASITGMAPHQTLNLGLPKGATGATGAKGDTGNTGAKGDTGAPGAAATIAVGTVATGAPSAPATVTNVGTSGAAVFDFTIPKGDKGEKGDPGTATIVDGNKGDITTSNGGDTFTIDNDAVTNAKLANMATATIKGRTTAGTGDPEDLSGTQATALLVTFTGDSGAGGAKGLTPAPAAGDAAAGRVLGASGGWVDPASLPAGMLAAFMMTSAPTGWLKANGAAVSLGTYPALIAIYCGDADNPTALHGYRCTNPASPSSTRSTTGGYIIVPDFRGEFIRGLDDGRGIDSGRSAWLAQGDLVKAHTHGVTDPGHNHNISDPGHTHGLVGGPNAPGTGTAGPALQSNNATSGSGVVGNTTNITIQSRVTSITVNANVGAENRPRNLAPLICIKY